MKEIWGAKIEKWEESLRYSDPKRIEVKTLLKEVDFRGKKVLDVGCGIGRLTIPLSKIARTIIGIDKDKKVIDYCKRKKNRRNIAYLHKNILNLKNQQLDIAILAQLVYDNFDKTLYSISNNLKPRGKLIIIRWIDKGNEYNKLLTPFWKINKSLIKEANIFSKKFTKIVKKGFSIYKVIKISTYESYPSIEKLKENIIRDSPIQFRKKELKKLDRLIRKYNYKKLNSL